MFQLQAIAISPRVFLRFAPTPLEPVARGEGELLNWLPKIRANRQPIFVLRNSSWRLGFAMKIEHLQDDVFFQRMVKTNSPSLIYRIRHVVPKPQGSLEHDFSSLAERNRELYVIPALIV